MPSRISFFRHKQCCLTLRSSRPAPAWHLARKALAVIIRLAGQAPCRRGRLSSNVRPLTSTNAMPREKNDLLIHYDENKQKFIFYSVKSSDTASLRRDAFDGVCPDVAHLKSLSPDDAEKSFGSLAFSLLDLGATKKVSIRDYQAESAVAHAEYVAELEQQATANDADAQYYLFIELHSQAMRTHSLEPLLRAESLLKAAASQGHPEATSRLEDWPLLKAAAQRHIDRGPTAA